MDINDGIESFKRAMVGRLRAIAVFLTEFQTKGLYLLKQLQEGWNLIHYGARKPKSFETDFAVPHTRDSQTFQLFLVGKLTTGLANLIVTGVEDVMGSSAIGPLALLIPLNAYCASLLFTAVNADAKIGAMLQHMVVMLRNGMQKQVHHLSNLVASLQLDFGSYKGNYIEFLRLAVDKQLQITKWFGKSLGDRECFEDDVDCDFMAKSHNKMAAAAKIEDPVTHIKARRTSWGGKHGNAYGGEDFSPIIDIITKCDEIVALLRNGNSHHIPRAVGQLAVMWNSLTTKMTSMSHKQDVWSMTTSIRSDDLNREHMRIGKMFKYKDVKAEEELQNVKLPAFGPVPQPPPPVPSPESSPGAEGFAALSTDMEFDSDSLEGKPSSLQVEREEDEEQQQQEEDDRRREDEDEEERRRDDDSDVLDERERSKHGNPERRREEDEEVWRDSHYHPLSNHKAQYGGYNRNAHSRAGNLLNRMNRHVQFQYQTPSKSDVPDPDPEYPNQNPLHRNDPNIRAADVVRQTKQEQMDSAIKEINSLRCMHGSPPLTWSTELAENAQKHASKHSGKYNFNEVYKETVDGAPYPGGAQSETIYLTMSKDGHFGDYGLSAIRAWYAEHLDCNTIPGCDNPSAKNPQAIVSSFTSIVWKSTAKVGCGASQFEENDEKKLFMVCRWGSVSPHLKYTPTAFTDNVLPVSEKEEHCRRQAGKGLTTGMESPPIGPNVAPPSSA